MEFVKAYLFISLGIYITASVINKHAYKTATRISILRGIVGTLFWPVALAILWKYPNKPIAMESNSYSYPEWLKKFTTDLHISSDANDEESKRYLDELIETLLDAPDHRLIMLIEDSPVEISLSKDGTIVVQQLDKNPTK